MAWIRRNFFLALGILLAVVLLGGGVYYFWTNRARNKEIEAKLEENKNTLSRLLNQNPFPSPTNIARAKQEVERVRAAVEQSKRFFQPVPFEKVTGEAFKTLLDNKLYELHQKAEKTSVVLPAKTYAFTFAHQKTQLQFPPEAFPAMPQMLAEIKTICDVLFDSKINKLITLRRARLYSDEPTSQVDHHDMKPEVYDTMGMAANPYEVTFHAFSTELGAAMESFYRSTNGLIVKSVTVEVAPAPGTDPNLQPGQAPQNVPFAPPVTQPRQPPPTAVATRPPGAPAAAGARPADTIKTVLNERLLKITLVLDVLRIAEKQTNAPPRQI